MKLIPILFSTAMVQAILEDRKTMTRRIVKPQLAFNEVGNVNFSFKKHGGINVPIEDLNEPFVGILDDCPYGQPGDVLWVRETWNVTTLIQSTNKKDIPGTKTIRYKANDDEFNRCTKGSMQWKPSIHMPKEVCRLFLKIKSIKVERLHDISEHDAIAEGIEIGYAECHLLNKSLITYKNYLTEKQIWMPAKHSFQTLWQSINGPESWEANPWVWVIEFEQIDKPENFK